jgi:hypothetical protein
MSTNNSFTCGVWADTIVYSVVLVKLVECERLGLKVRFERDTSLRISPSDLSPPPPFTFVERRRRVARENNNAAEIRHRHHHRSHNTRNHIAEVHFGSVRVVSLYNNPVSHKLNQFYILFMLLNIKYKMEGLSCNSIGNMTVYVYRNTQIIRALTIWIFYIFLGFGVG